MPDSVDVCEPKPKVQLQPDPAATQLTLWIPTPASDCVVEADAASWAQLEPLRQLAGTFSWIDTEVVVVSAYVESALNMSVPEALYTGCSVKLGQDALCTEPDVMFAQESTIFHVPAMGPPQAGTLLQVLLEEEEELHPPSDAAAAMHKPAHETYRPPMARR